MLPLQLPLRVETDRLQLVPLTDDHAIFIFDLLNSAGWLQFIGDRQIRHEQDAILYIQKINQNQQLRYWIIQLRSCGTSIGILTLIQRSYLDHPDLGFALLPSFHKKGFASEAAKCLSQLLFQECNLSKLLATTLSNNHASIQLLSNLGFQLKGQIQPESIPLLLYELMKEP